MLVNKWLRPGFLYAPNDPPSGSGDSDVMKELRSQITTLTRDLGNLRDSHKTLETENADLKSKVAESAREKLTEVERLKAEKTDLENRVLDLTGKTTELETLRTLNTNLSGYVSKLYDSSIQAVPEAERENVKSITFVEGNPMESLSKLENAFKVLKITPTGSGIVAGTITIPNSAPDPGGSGSQGGSGDKKYDPLKVTWADGLRTREQILAEGRQRGQIK